MTNCHDGDKPDMRSFSLLWCYLLSLCIKYREFHDPLLGHDLLYQAIYQNREWGPFMHKNNNGQILKKLKNVL